MKPPGSYKIAHRQRPHESSYLDAVVIGRDRAQRIVDSLRYEISRGSDSQSLRIRQVFSTPREIYRIELSSPDLGYQRTTLLDRDALEELLEADEVQSAIDKADL